MTYLEAGLDSESARRLKELATEVGALMLGDFTLASGKKSAYYFDAKKLTLSPEGAYRIGKAMYDELAKLPLDAVGGVATGAYPIATAVTLVSYLEHKPLPAFMVRETVKEHGTKRLIEGHLKEGFRVAIVEDVITTGGSVYKVIEAVKAAGCRVVKVIALVDRHEGGGEKLRADGYDFTALLHLKAQ